MPCASLYLSGTNQGGPGQAPPTPFWNNPAIQLTSTTLTKGVSHPIPVQVQNIGDVSPSISLELFWSDPATGFLAVIAQRIGQQVLPNVGPRTVIPPEDGHVEHTFNWTPSTTITYPNDGHVCLLARVEMLSTTTGCPQETYDQANPTTDRRTAIRNVHLVAMKRKMSGAFAFAFGAMNIGAAGANELVVRPLDPKRDKKRLGLLVDDPAVDRFLGDTGQFALPKDVGLVEGRERIVVPERFLKEKSKRLPPRLGQTGALTVERSKQLIAPAAKTFAPGKALPFDLAHLEARQTIVQVVPGESHEFYAIDVEHKGADGKVIGGLTLVLKSRAKAY